MSLDRPDVKLRLAPEYHRALRRIAEARGVGMNEWVRDLVMEKIRELVHEASVIAESAPELGISGRRGAKAGAAGRNGARQGEEGSE